VRNILVTEEDYQEEGNLYLFHLFTDISEV